MPPGIRVGNENEMRSELNRDFVREVLALIRSLIYTPGRNLQQQRTPGRTAEELVILRIVDETASLATEEL